MLTGGYHFPELAVLSAEEREVLLDLAVAMFMAHSVCFRETDPLTARSYLVFPELINLRKPVIADEQPIEEGVAYTVSGAVGNVYASLVVLCGNGWPKANIARSAPDAGSRSHYLALMLRSSLPGSRKPTLPISAGQPVTGRASSRCCSG
ncbi:MAG: hypothetical protein ACRDTA_14620 [Pseudonocardiaceae bacterium]